MLTTTSTIQAQSHFSKSSYFLPFNWNVAYPGAFTAQFHPDSATVSVTPIDPSFGGITFIGVYTSIACGQEPACTARFSSPASGQVALPQGFFPCALGAQPLFLLIRWKVKPLK